MIWRIGSGLTIGSKFVVRKSQKILGQKKPSSAAATWSELMLVMNSKWYEMVDVAYMLLL
jgi:hypothetical protein